MLLASIDDRDGASEAVAGIVVNAGCCDDASAADVAGIVVDAVCCDVAIAIVVTAVVVAAAGVARDEW